jgi:hypothetical protein
VAGNRLLEEVLLLRRAPADPAGLAATLGNLGLAAVHAGHFDRARGYLEESAGALSDVDDSSELQILRAP